MLQKSQQRHTFYNMRDLHTKIKRIRFFWLKKHS